jgi:hypothetical protein
MAALGVRRPRGRRASGVVAVGVMRQHDNSGQRVPDDHELAERRYDLGRRDAPLPPGGISGAHRGMAVEARERNGRRRRSGS